jgi:hypothetical protein
MSPGLHGSHCSAGSPLLPEITRIVNAMFFPHFLMGNTTT